MFYCFENQISIPNIVLLSDVTLIYQEDYRCMLFMLYSGPGNVTDAVELNSVEYEHKNQHVIK